jgi:16S rRNA (uracil1498-N3)-methyltransferase
MASPPRVFVPGPLHPGTLSIEGDPAKRLASVLRLRPGDAFALFCGDGREYEATFAGATGKRVAAIVGPVARQEPPAALSLELYCGLVRATRFDTVVEKATEAGADVIAPLISEHAARGEHPSPARYERWERIAIEAAEQSGRLYVPVLAQPVVFEVALRSPGTLALLCDPAGSPWNQVAALLPKRGRLLLLIGPEGGFSDGEVAAARRAGALVAAIAPNVLRTETAAIVATALVRAAGID